MDFSNGVRMEPKPHYYGGWWTEYGGCNSSSCNSCVMVYLKTRKQRFNQIFPVNTVETMKLEYRVAKTTGLVTVALILSFVSAVILSLLGDFFQFFIKMSSWRVEETLMLSNSFVNPLIYCYRVHHFREAVFEILWIKKPTCIICCC